MKNIFKAVLPALMFMLVMTMTIEAANAKVTSFSATASDKTITVSGEAEEAMVACAITVYDSTGEQLLSMKTTAVDDSNKFSDTITVDADGTYVVRVADYEGGSYEQTSVVVQTDTSSTTGTTPSETASSTAAPASDSTVAATGSKTSDANHPEIWFAILGAAVVGGFGLYGYNNKIKR